GGAPPRLRLRGGRRVLRRAPMAVPWMSGRRTAPVGARLRGRSPDRRGRIGGGRTVLPAVRFRRWRPCGRRTAGGPPPVPRGAARRRRGRRVGGPGEAVCGARRGGSPGRGHGPGLGGRGAGRRAGGAPPAAPGGARWLRSIA